MMMSRGSCNGVILNIIQLNEVDVWFQNRLITEIGVCRRPPNSNYGRQTPAATE
jgi:hypothetical protein